MIRIWDGAAERKMQWKMAGKKRSRERTGIPNLIVIIMNGMHLSQQLPVVDSGPSLGENGAEIRSLPPHRVYSIYIYIYISSRVNVPLACHRWGARCDWDLDSDLDSVSGCGSDWSSAACHTSSNDPNWSGIAVELSLVEWSNGAMRSENQLRGAFHLTFDLVSRNFN